MSVRTTHTRASPLSHDQAERDLETCREKPRITGKLTAEKIQEIEEDVITEYKYIGHNFNTPTTHEEKRIRIWNHNLDTLTTNQPNKVAEELILIKKAKIDVILWQDPKITHTTRNTLLQSFKDYWGGQQMEDKLWTGPKEMPNSKRHGIWVLVHSKWVGRIKEWIVDDTNLARYGGVVLEGSVTKNGTIPRRLGLVSTYSPPIESQNSKWIMKKIGGKNTKAVLEKLMDDLSALEFKYKNKKVDMVYTGDFNATWNL